MVGAMAGAAAALGATDTALLLRCCSALEWGALMAGLLNAASNAPNQVYDIEVDRINKPDRPLPSGRMSVQWAMGQAVGLYAVACYWPGLTPQCRWTRMFCARVLGRLVHGRLQRASPSNETLRVEGQPDHCHSEGAPSEGGRMVHRRSGLLRRGTVGPRRTFLPVPSGSEHRQGLRRHRRR